MRREFQPDYRNLEAAARNWRADRLPLYEHNVSFKKIGEIMGKDLESLYQGDERDVEEFFSVYSEFFRMYGYDAVTFEACIGQIFPGGGALGDSRVDPVIKTREDFEKYPWEELEERYFQKNSRYFRALRRQMPEGMKAVGGVGNGIFECVQELTGFQGLCYIGADDQELYAELFRKVGEIHQSIWKRFMREFGDVYCVLRFGDDLGYKSNSLLSTEDIRTHIFPWYRKTVELVHSYGKPFLLHSCGNIFHLMDDLIGNVGIDAKHSNEDQIAPFPEWVERYGDRIGNFGGFDVDKVCFAGKAELREYIRDVLAKCQGHGGIAAGTGNSIPDYVPTGSYLDMIEAVREYRGE